MHRHANQTAFTLIELIAALAIAASIAAISIQYLRPAGVTSQQRSCDLTRELLQSDAQRYQATLGRAPSANLSELANSQYSGTPLPRCPITGESYRLGRDGTVGCPTHETTRSK
jgi:prepilin-type N-terminal cleavage/methylation domain-containing protein